MLASLASLASRNDAAAWSDVASTPDALAAGARVLRVGDATVVVVPSVDHMLFNRAFCVDPGALPRIARVYEKAGVRRWVAHVSEDALPQPDQLHANGVESFHRPWAKLARHRGPVEGPVCELPVEPARPTDAAAVGALFRAGFELPHAATALVSALVERERWQVLVARDQLRVVGIGLAFDGHGGCSLEGGVTEPAYRGRGIQGALMAERVRRAFARGAGWVSSETGVAIPGQANSSWRNMERCGLRQVGLWHNVVPTGVSWSS